MLNLFAYLAVNFDSTVQGFLIVLRKSRFKITLQRMQKSKKMLSTCPLVY